MTLHRGETVQTRRRASPLLPTEVIVRPEDQEEAQDGGEDDDVSRQDKRTGSPLDLRTITLNIQATIWKSISSVRAFTFKQSR